MCFLDSSPSMVILISIYLLTGHWFFHGRAPASGTSFAAAGPRLWNTCRLHCDIWPATDSLGDIWQHICLEPKIMAHCDVRFFAPYKYSYLLITSIIPVNLILSFHFIQSQSCYSSPLSFVPTHSIYTIISHCIVETNALFQLTITLRIHLSIGQTSRKYSVLV